MKFVVVVVVVVIDVVVVFVVRWNHCRSGSGNEAAMKSEAGAKLFEHFTASIQVRRNVRADGWAEIQTRIIPVVNECKSPLMC